MDGTPTTIALPPARWAAPLTAVLAVVWVGAALGVWRLLVWYQGTAGQEKASQLGTLSLLVLVGLFVIGLQLVRALSDARITFTDEELRLHSGEKKEPIRLARIAEVQPESPGRPVVLVLHGSTRGIAVPSSSLLTGPQRAALVEDLRVRRARARRLAKSRREAEQAAARAHRLVVKDAPTPPDARPGSRPPSGAERGTWPTRDDAARSATSRS